MTTTQASEQDIRLDMLNSFLSCPHRDMDKIKEVHEQLQAQDPRFYAHLACWYLRQGELRDVKEMFIAMLCVDSFTENREVGLALFQNLPTFMKRRVLGYIKGKKVKIRHKTGAKKKIKGKQVDEVRIEEKTVGLFKNVPTSFKKEVETYVRYLEANNDRFDAIAMKSGKDLKTLYASLKIRPSKRAQAILFTKKYPKSSKLDVFKKIAEEKSPDKVAELLVEHKVPYTTAVGLIDQVTPSILAALVNNMSPQEVINNVAALEERGAMDHPGVKKLIDAKLEKAKKAKGVSALKGKVAKKTGRVKNDDVAKKLDDVADEQVKSKASIRVPTAVFVDCSGSMHSAIEVGKSCAALISGATTADLHVVAFDNMPHEIVAQGNGTLTDWEQAFRGISAGGSTSMGCALRLLRSKGAYVEQIVIVTDGGENASPMLLQEYPAYEKALNVKPNVVIINMGRAARAYSNMLNANGVESEVYSPSPDDYYSLPGLIPLLAKSNKLDLLLEIMSTPLVKRRKYKQVAPYPEQHNAKATRKMILT